MADLRTGDAAATRAVPPSAVVWISRRQAIVATMGCDGRISTREINRGLEAELPYLALVVRAIGDRERVVILGPSSIRLSLEREYVAVYRRPERLVDVEPAGALHAEELVGRLHALAS